METASITGEKSMKYYLLGKSGLRVSELAFGATGVGTWFKDEG
jgi:hypothetical protein